MVETMALQAVTPASGLRLEIGAQHRHYNH
jgi:hypothetical protein